METPTQDSKQAENVMCASTQEQQTKEKSMSNLHIEEIPVEGYEKVLVGKDDATGLHALIAIHNTNRGPAIGGTRFWPYESQDEALDDVTRLARGMTYKSAVANNPFGGGKSVIIGDPKALKNRKLLHSFAQFVDSLNGDYICAEDMNTTDDDMRTINEVTKHVAGIIGGNPSPVTAIGVHACITMTAREFLGFDDLSKLHVVLQGAGAVGSDVVRHLRKDGVKVTMFDINHEHLQKLADETGAIIGEGDPFSAECDIFSPCARGAVLNDETIPQLKCKAVIGAANNQLAEDRHARMLQEHGILYGPDYVVNAGGIVNVRHEREPEGYSSAAAKESAKAIPDTLREIFLKAQNEGMTAAEAADRIAEERFGR